ncbi:MAG: branched-chain amino acid ABC transporter permease [Syntrophales bacterium]|jgi:branched-chain amino acid transport system permease protein|nr:branched-chain amino acid ABC transporter permease [Syntrophales bacterium]MDY0045318.1 branched-chain amino acid ABC transporter permease [Syntrophales bacterium]
MEVFLQTLANGVMASLTLALIAIGLCLIFGILSIINFAHGEFYMLGGFGVWWFLEAHPIFAGMPALVGYIIAILISMVVVAVIGMIVEKWIFRPVREPHETVMIVSLGVMLFLQAAALVAFGPVDKSVSSPFAGLVQLGTVSFSNERLAAIIGCIIFIAILYVIIDRTRMGKAMRAVAMDSEAAEVQGIKTGMIFSVAMGVSCAIAAAGGALVGPIYYINPYMAVEPIMKAFAAVILGGLGSLPGAVAGAFIIGLTETFVSTYVGAHFALIVVFLIMIGVLIVKPTGLFGHEE